MNSVDIRMHGATIEILIKFHQNETIISVKVRDNGWFTRLIFVVEVVHSWGIFGLHKFSASIISRDSCYGNERKASFRNGMRVQHPSYSGYCLLNQAVFTKKWNWNEKTARKVVT